jgi:hypothetical protein
MEWAYCSVCKKGCFTNEHSVTHLDCKNWIVEHSNSPCRKRFANVEYLFSGYDEIKTEEAKPTEVNTELLEAQKIIEQLRTENAALRASMDSLKMTKECEPTASLPLLEVQEKDDGTETDSMALKAATKSIGTLHDKITDLKSKLSNSYDNHRSTIAHTIGNINKLEKEDPVRLIVRAYLVNVKIGDEEEEDEDN